MLSSLYKAKVLSSAVSGDVDVPLEKTASRTSLLFWLPRVGSADSTQSLGVRMGFGLLLLATLLALYLRVGVGLATQWWNDPNYSHGFFVPILAVWVLWQSRQQLEEITPQPSWWGLAIILAAMALLIVGTLGAELYLSRVSFVLLLAGLAIHFYGWRYFRIGFFPWLISRNLS